MGNNTSAPKITAQDKAILDLKVQRDKLKQYQSKITHLTTLETRAAKDALAQHNRRAALLALRRKKYQETLLQRTDQQLEQLQNLASDVEFALVQKDVVYGLQRGTEVLKEIRKEMGGVEGVERLMGRNEEEKAYQEEISEMLSGQLSRDDEEDVEEELRALEGVRLPQVPEKVDKVSRVRKEEEEEVADGGLPTPPTEVKRKPENVQNSKENVEEPLPA